MGCRCGYNQRRQKGPCTSSRKYLSKRRCKCAISNVPCCNLCNCHGECGGKKCGGSYKETGKRTGRKRKQHEIQKIKGTSGSKEFLEIRKEQVNPGKVNMLEYVVVTASVLYQEVKSGTSNIMKVKQCYDNIMSFLIKHSIAFPISAKSLTDLEKVLRKIFAVRRTLE